MKSIALCFLELTSFLFFIQIAQAQQPVISSVSPAAGNTGASVIINGSNFDATPGNNNVFFGAAKAVVTTASPTQLSVTVPAGALHYPVTVNTATGTGYSSQAFLPTHPAGVVNFNNRCFAAAVDAATATAPESAVLIDLDGDGKPDMVTANSTAGNISVFRSTSTNGTVSFAAKVDIAGGTSPVGIAAGDLNGDGKPDIAVTNLAVTPKVSVFINTSTAGSVSFAARVEFTAGSSPRGIDINDIDADGKPDIIVTNQGAASFSVFQNTTTGGTVSFAPKMDFVTGSNPYNITARDIDGDGKADVAVTNQTSGNISVFRNTSTAGSISFAAKIDFATGTLPRGIAAGDVDADGKPDIATGNFGTSNISVLRNTSTTGSISFAAKVDFALAPLAQTEQLAIGDLNGDGKPDIAVPDPYTGNLHVNVFRNTSVSGTVSFAARVFYGTGAGSAPRNIVIGDVDGDGRPDMGVVCNGNNKVSVFRNITPPVINNFSPVTAQAGSSVTITGYNFRNTAAENLVFFGAAKATVTASSNTSLTVTVPNGSTHLPISVTADGLTGHAKLPFVLTFSGGDSIIANSFKARVLGGGTSNGKDIVMDDFDGDGKNDVVTQNYANSTLTSFRNMSSGGNIFFLSSGSVTNFGNSVGLASGDLNGDGKPELIAAEGPNNAVTIYRNTSTVAILFATGITIGVSAEASAAFVADLNDDGRPEVIVDTKGYIAILPNTTTGTGTLSFGTPVLIGMVDYRDRLAVADFDGDGKVDIVSGQSAMRNTSTNGVISFSSLSNFAPVLISDFYVTADFNGDGKPDLAELTSNQRRVRFYSNTSTPGTISFSLQAGTYKTGTYPVKMAAADLNGDSKPDIAVCSEEQDAMSVFANATTGSAIQFIPKVDYAAGHWPYGTALGDLDGDAKPDMVVANWQDNSFSVLQFGLDVVPSNLPKVNSFTPASGPVGTTVSISGNNFGNTVNDNIVFFGGVKAEVTSANATSLTVKIPVGAANNKLFSVTNAAGLTGYSQKPFRVIFPGGGPVFTATSFDTAKIFAASTDPWGLCMGDLDGDGKNDVALANSGSGSVSVFRNKSIPGGVAFDARTDIAAGSSPKACTIADLNADGKPELLVANAASNTVSVFRNTSTPGVISFAAPVLCYTDSSGFGNPLALLVHDLDGDGKPDLAVANANSTYCTFFRNTTSSPGGPISFAWKVSYIGGYSPNILAVCDLDNNGKPDIVAGNEGQNQLFVLSNTSTVGMISFARGENFSPNSTYGISGIVVTDVDENNSFDFAFATASNGLSQMLNQSIRGTHNFQAPDNYGPGGIASKHIAGDDLDGDGRLDMAMLNLFERSALVYKGRDSAQSYFRNPYSYLVTPGTHTATDIITGDIDGDGKPDIATCTISQPYLTILRNKVGEPERLCPNGGITLTSHLTGAASYQWQVSTDNGATFTNISNNANYNGTATIALQLATIPSSWTGYQYRCVANGLGTETFTIRFYNTWTGAINSQWENPGNWSCGAVPDIYTDVVINPGATIVVNSNVSIATLIVGPGASFTVNAPFTVTLLGH